MDTPVVTIIKDEGLGAVVGVAIAPDATFALAGNYNKHNIARIDLQQSPPRVVSYISHDAIRGPEGVAISFDGTFALFANNMNRDIGHIDLRTNIVTFPYKCRFKGMYGIAIAPDNAYCLPVMILQRTFVD